jgi:hypothetical protein
MIGHEEADNVRPVPSKGIGVCLNGHTGRHRGDAGGHHPAAFFILYDAEPTGPCGFKVGMIAQSGDPDTVIPRRFENSGSWIGDDWNSIDDKANLFHAAPLEKKSS